MMNVKPPAPFCGLWQRGPVQTTAKPLFASICSPEVTPNDTSGSEGVSDTQIEPFPVPSLSRFLLFSILNLHRHTSALPLMTASAPRPAALQPASAASRRRRHNTHNSLNGLTDVYDTVSPFGCSSGLVLSSPSPLPRKRPTPNVASREQSSASPPF